MVKIKILEQLKSPVAVIIPLYKVSPSDLEKISIQQCFNVLHSHKIIAIKPDHLSLSNYDFIFDEVISFDNTSFKDPAGYNKLMRSPHFYDKFLAYEFILIYQPDAFVFRDDLIYWCNQGYDYIGAPWLRFVDYPDVFKKAKNLSKRFLHTKLNIKMPGTDLPSEIQLENRVGNGGFSLRNVAKFHQICLHNRPLIDYYDSRPEHQFGEDVFFGVEVNRFKEQLKIPDFKTAVYFSMETALSNAFRLTEGQLPFGCHAWDRQLEFWRPYFKAAGVMI